MNITALRRFRLILWSLVVLAALGATALFIFAPPRGPVAGSIGAGDYSLIDTNGQKFDPARLRDGNPSLVFFGFTNCPDVCPTTMASMMDWFQQLGPEAAKVKGYLVTVDPERDTPDILKDYVSWTEGRITGVTGSLAELTKMAQAWKIFFEKAPIEGTDDYTMNHTASTFLIDGNGEFVGTIAFEENPATALAKVRRLAAGT